MPQCNCGGVLKGARGISAAVLRGQMWGAVEESAHGLLSDLKDWTP